MSVSEVASRRGARAQRVNCKNCNRTIVVTLIEGVRVEVDAELIEIVTSNDRRITGRRPHAASCVKNQSDAARTAALQIAKRKPVTP